MVSYVRNGLMLIAPYYQVEKFGKVLLAKRLPNLPVVALESVLMNDKDMVPILINLS